MFRDDDLVKIVTGARRCCQVILFDDVLKRCLQYGGMPAITSLGIPQEEHSIYFSGLYDAVATRDILDKERFKGQNKITDPALLEKVTALLGDNVGDKLSMKSIADALTSTGTKTASKTLDSYAKALNEAYLFSKADGYDLYGKILRTNPKQYIVDLGFRSFLGGYRSTRHGTAVRERGLPAASLQGLVRACGQALWQRGRFHRHQRWQEEVYPSHRRDDVQGHAETGAQASVVHPRRV